jgi:hypothetical protein
MKVDLEDIMFWMDAIRNSEDRYRTLESFWKGQLRSKEWLVKSLEEMNIHDLSHVVIHGGWYGVLASLLFNSNIDIRKITSIDIDPECEKIASTMNKRYEIDGRFTAVTIDMCDYIYDADLTINTSCEHITQSQYEIWLSNVPQHSLIVLQSNNYFDHPEHIRCSENLDDFVKTSKIDVIWKDEMQLQKYKRFMLIGRKSGTSRDI